MPEEDLVELKFRLYDGTDIGPIQYSSASTVAMLKERIVTEWPRDKKVVPKAANDVKLISAGKILENNKAIAQCRLPFGELPGGVLTMHVVVQPSLTKTKTVVYKQKGISDDALLFFPKSLLLLIEDIDLVEVGMNALTALPQLMVERMTSLSAKNILAEKKVDEMPKSVCSCSIL